MRTFALASLLLAGPIVLSCSDRGAGAGSPRAALEKLVDALDALDRERVEQCFDTSSPEAATAAGTIGRLVGLARKGREFEASVRSRFGSDALPDLGLGDFRVDRWRSVLERGSIETFTDGARLNVEGRSPVQFVLRLGRWYVFAPSIFDADASAAKGRWEGVLAGFESYYDEAARALGAAKDAASFRREMNALGTRTKAKVGAEFQGVMQAVWSTGR